MATSSISTTGVISAAGIGSGLDVGTIVTQLMAVEARPLELLKTQAGALNTRMSTIGKLQSLFATMRDKANALVAPSLWRSTTASSSDDASVKAKAAEGALAASHLVEVAQLAAGQTVVASALPSAASTLSAGTLTIELGRWSDATPPSFTPKDGASPATITIAPGATSLAQVRDAINAAGAGVTASIVTDATGARLALRSSATGEVNGFRISAAEDADDASASTGLSMIAYDAADAATPTQRVARAQDTRATVDGIAVTTAGTTLDGVVEGLTLTASRVTASPVTVAVASDSARIKAAVDEFVAAFNAVASFIRTQTAYNDSSKTGGPLQGDSGTLALQGQLRAIINRPTTAGGASEVAGATAGFARLSQAGITMARDGTLSLDAAKLDAALVKLPALREAFAADGDGDADSGFMRRFKDLADRALGADGVFDGRSAMLRSSLERNSRAQSDMQRRLDIAESRLRAQYGALDSTMAKMNGLASYITQQMRSGFGGTGGSGG